MSIPRNYDKVLYHEGRPLYFNSKTKHWIWVDEYEKMMEGGKEIERKLFRKLYDKG